MDSIRALILYQDHHLVVCNKPAGMPVQEDPTGDASLHRIVQAYCKKDLFLVHRIDRPVSGIVVFARNKDAVADISAQQADKRFQKQYLVVVEKKSLDPHGSLRNKLVHSTKTKKAYVQEEGDGKASELHYEILHELDRYLVLKVELSTGRFHQIRAQLAHAGLPVKGDVKYGARRGNKDRSIGLHAWKLNFFHPSTHVPLTLEAPLPENDLWPVVQKLLHPA